MWKLKIWLALDHEGFVDTRTISKIGPRQAEALAASNLENDGWTIHKATIEIGEKVK
jgi:hypothetical protein